jgi:regulation of enolase protein 1 (concanavalin A-like superfamily)
VATPDNGVSLQWDSDGDGFLDQGRQQAAAAPVWLRLSREGDQVTAEYSANGTDWTQLGAPVTAAGAASTQDAGMIFTAHSTSVGQAQFSEFAVETVDGGQAG